MDMGEGVGRRKKLVSIGRLSEGHVIKRYSSTMVVVHSTSTLVVKGYTGMSVCSMYYIVLRVLYYSTGTENEYKSHECSNSDNCGTSTCTGTG